MKLFSYFSSDLIKPSWKYSAEHTIWRIMFSDNGLIIGEDRNAETKTVSFFCLNAFSGKPLWQNKTFDEQWWIGVDAVSGNRLYLHGFKKPDMPEHKNIIAVDIQTGNVVWQNTECTFAAIQPPFVFGYQDLFERRVYYSIDEKTGVKLDEMASLPEGLAANIQYEKTDFTFPEPVTTNDTFCWSIASASPGYKNAEFIDLEAYSILNVYAQNTAPLDGLKNTLSIIDSSTKKKVYSDVLNGSTPYPVPDSFFADKKRIYYIKERKVLIAVDLKIK